jgi:hypothetical protein
MMNKFRYRDHAGNIKDGEVRLEDYEMAMSRNMRTSAFVNAKYPDADPRFGTAWSQALKYNGIYPKAEPQFGILPSSVHEILSGQCATKMAGTQLAGGTITSVNGPIGNSTPSTRIFFPELVLSIMDEYLQGMYDQEMSAYNSMFAITESVQSDIFTVPVINTTAPQAQDPTASSENAMPVNMVSISASQKSYAMSSWSIGLQISEKAQRDASIDLVSIILREQAEGQRRRQLWRDLNRVVIGNIDSGEKSLTPVDFKCTYDTTAAANTLTQKGWLGVLSDPDRIWEYDMILGDLQAYMDIQNRVGRPIATDPTATSAGLNTGNAGTYGLNVADIEMINFRTMAPKFLRVPDGLVTTRTMCLFDTRYALRRVVATSAPFSAVQDMVMQRTTQMRFDGASFVNRLREEAFLWLDYSNDAACS